MIMLNVSKISYNAQNYIEKHKVLNNILILLPFAFIKKL